MESIHIAREMIGLQRTLFNNALAVVTTMQQHGEDFLKKTLEQSPWLPESSKSGYLFCADYYAKSLENLKSVAELSFAEIERISMSGVTPEVKTSQQTTSPERTALPRPTKKTPAVKEKKVGAKKTVAAKTTVGKKALIQNAPADKPVVPNALAEKPIQQKTATEKSVVQKVPAEKQVVHEKPEIKESPEVQTAASAPKLSDTGRKTAEPVSGNKVSGSPQLEPKG